MVRFDDALQAVRSGFRAADESLPTLESERWLELLDALVDRGLQGLRGELAVHKFLYHGALHFDRWAAPTPVVVRSDDEPAFGRFLDALTDLEGHRSDNVLPLRVHRLRSELFRCHAHLYNQVPNRHRVRYYSGTSPAPRSCRYPPIRQSASNSSRAATI